MKKKGNSTNMKIFICFAAVALFAPCAAARKQNPESRKNYV